MSEKTVGSADKKTETKSENSVSPPQKSDSSQFFGSPVEHILFLQRTIGNQAAGRLISSGALQTKLRVNEPGDIYEQEADRVAEQVMRMTCDPGDEECERKRKLEEEEEIQMKSLENANQIQLDSESSPDVPPEIEEGINSSKSGGQPLSESVRSFFEPRFDSDFSQVRIHNDSNAGNLNRALSARAFTTGKDIFFSEGAYRPETSGGKELLAHELTHVVQQSGDGIRYRLNGGKSGEFQELDEGIQKKRPETIHAKGKHDSNTEMMPENESNFISVVSGGKSLPEYAREFFEPQFGDDFSKVNILIDAKAMEVAKAVNSAVFSMGNEDVSVNDRFKPETVQRKWLLGHDLPHVMQQTGQMGSISIQCFGDKPHEEIEDSALDSYFPEKERKQIALGNWQNDYNQMSLISKYAPTIGITLTEDDCFEIANIIAEVKFGPEIAQQMDKERFGKYTPGQHFDNPLTPEKDLGQDAVPGYIKENIKYVKQIFEKSIDAYKNANKETNADVKNKGFAVAREYFGSALHIMEDFFAHSNFVEIALNLKKKSKVDTYGGKTASGRYRLVSGNFEDLDTAISIMKIVAGYLKTPTEPNKAMTAGDRITLVILRRNNPTIANYYEKFLFGVDQAKRYIPGFKYIAEMFQTIKDSLASQLGAGIEILSKKLATGTGKGNQPSHTQVNKDDPSQNRFFLAKQLATHVVKNITPKMDTAWKNPDDPTAKNELFKLIDEFTQHPDSSSWWHNIVEKSR